MNDKRYFRAWLSFVGWNAIASAVLMGIGAASAAAAEIPIDNALSAAGFVALIVSLPIFKRAVRRHIVDRPQEPQTPEELARSTEK